MKNSHQTIRSTNKSQLNDKNKSKKVIPKLWKTYKKIKSAKEAFLIYKYIKNITKMWQLLKGLYQNAIKKTIAERKYNFKLQEVKLENYNTITMLLAEGSILI